ncbi:MAG: hypothetical protein H8E34_10960 [Bacteroidetes bacterium]|nr:hypothetical protein [Bacteroidota bacterium]
MKYLKIQSKGEIDINAFTLLGASTKKKDDSKIGFFGSGLKYAVASLLRNNIEFRIFSGETEVTFGVKPIKFREEEFNKIVVGGEVTSLTDAMGGDDWDEAFAPIREIYSNALDEDSDSTVKITENINPEATFTKVYIQMTSEMQDLYDNFDMYFLSKRSDVMFSNDFGAVYPATNKKKRLFRKGILCFSSNAVAFFHYNSSKFEINESRTLKDEWYAKRDIARCWGACSNVASIAEIVDVLNVGHKSSERYLEWSHVEFSDSWLSFCENKKFYAIEHEMIFNDYDKRNRIRLPLSMLGKLIRQYGDSIDVLGLSKDDPDEAIHYIKNPSQTLMNKVLDAISILRNTRYVERFNDPKIRIANFSDEYKAATIKDGVIVLASKLDSMTIHEIAKILIEENEHILSGYGDETREFQNHLFNLYFEELTRKELDQIEDKENIFVDLTESK